MSGKCDELKDKWFNAYPEIMGIEGDEPTQCYGKADVDAAIAELKDVIHELQVDLEGAKATHYAESVDAGMRERRLKRALYKACANWACAEYMGAGLINIKYPENWDEMKRKCRAKAEQYK